MTFEPKSGTGTGPDCPALRNGTPLIHHSDQGSQDAAWLHTEKLLEAHVQISRSDTGMPQQNGRLERFFRTLKEELIDFLERQMASGRLSNTGWRSSTILAAFIPPWIMRPQRRLMRRTSSAFVYPRFDCPN
jgi:transposase InsO family protein